MSQPTTRVVLYSHDALGLGHARRNLAIAQSLASGMPNAMGNSATGLLVAGITISGVEPPAGFDWLTLPGFAKGPSGYCPRRLLGHSPDALAALRSEIIGSVLGEFAPDLVIIDRHIAGVRGELTTPLCRLRETSPNTRIVLGLRDVLDHRLTTDREWAALGGAKAVRELVDSVWIYGDPTIHDATATGEVPSPLADVATFTGYLSEHRTPLTNARPAHHPDEPFILTTVGGGSDGLDLLLAAARMTPPPGHAHLIVTGPQLSADQRQRVVAEATHPATTVVGCVPNLASLIEDAAAVIAMGGYNTSCEILATSTPTLIVPRNKPRLEQTIRAKAFAAAGLVDVLHPENLTPNALTNWGTDAVHRTVDRSSHDGSAIASIPGIAARLLAQTARKEVA